MRQSFVDKFPVLESLKPGVNNCWKRNCNIWKLFFTENPIYIGLYAITLNECDYQILKYCILHR